MSFGWDEAGTGQKSKQEVRQKWMTNMITVKEKLQEKILLFCVFMMSCLVFMMMIEAKEIQWRWWWLLKNHRKLHMVHLVSEYMFLTPQSVRPVVSVVCITVCLADWRLTTAWIRSQLPTKGLSLPPSRWFKEERTFFLWLLHPSLF